MKSQTPNILWIMTDQHHADCMSFLGSQCHTPNLDKLAADGVTFERAYCNNPICGPSRVSFLTGQYVHHHGIAGNYLSVYPERNSDTLPTLFRREGYRNAMIGKAHLPRIWVSEGFEHIRYCDMADADPMDPLTCHYFKYLDDLGLSSWYEEGTPRPGSLGYLDGSAPAALPYEHSIERYTSNETLKYLNETQNDPRPFYIQMNFQRPHSPIRPAREYFDLYNAEDIVLPDSAVDWFENRMAGKPSWMIDQLKDECCQYPFANPDPTRLQQLLASYYAIVTCIDMEIGRVIEHLKTTGQYDNTAIVYSADHGDFAGDHGLFHKNYGIYESIHRIPLIVRTPTGPHNQRRNQIVESVDLYPTLCELADLTPPQGIDGQSIIPMLEDSNVPGKKEALCEWSWMPPADRVNAIRTDRYRLVYYNHEIGGELYDHQTDPGEVHNLWHDEAHLTIRFELMARLFDHVSHYQVKCDMNDDKDYKQQHRFSPRQLVKSGQIDWPTLHKTMQTPCPAHDPNPPCA